jgi:UDP-N-acetylmuramyl pentapeptide synthase
MDFLLSIVKPDIAILSVVAPNHLEQFGSFELYRKEKLLLIENAKQAIVHESLRPYV